MSKTNGSNVVSVRVKVLDVVVEMIAEQLYCNIQELLKTLTTDRFREFLAQQEFSNFYEASVFRSPDIPWDKLPLMQKRLYIGKAEHILSACPLAFIAQFEKWVAMYKKNHPAVCTVGSKVE